MDAQPPSDLSWGAFSDTPPWVLERDGLRWRADGGAALAVLRRTTRAEVPELTRHRRLPPGPRVVETALRLGVAVGGWARRERGRGREVSRAGISRRMRVAAEALGPTYIKLAQIISSGEGLFPDELVREMRRCRDQVPAEPWDAVRRCVEEELGRPLDEVFERFEPVPLAAASIAQVHVARLRTGEDVVVKVQRPGIDRTVRQDLRAMSWLAPFLVGRIAVSALANPPALVELFAECIVEELDFRLEAENMLDVAVMLAELGQRGYVIPRPHPELVTRRMLVMERLSGFAFDDVVGMQAAGVDTTAVIRTGLIAFMEGALLHGIFHGDLHGGNLFVLADGRTALLDFGITGRLSEPRRLAFLRLMLGATTNDAQAQLAALRDLGALPPDTDLAAVAHDLGLDRPPVDPTTLTGEELVTEIQRTVKALLAYGARLPKELMLYVKNMVFVSGAIGLLAPDLDMLGEVQNVSVQFLTRHGVRLSQELGVDLAKVEIDPEGLKAAMGLNPEVESFTWRDLQERRAVIEKRLKERNRS